MLDISVVDNLEQDILEDNKEVDKQDKPVEDTLTGDSLVEHISAEGNLVLDILAEDTLENSKKENKLDTLDDNWDIY